MGREPGVHGALTGKQNWKIWLQQELELAGIVVSLWACEANDSRPPSTSQAQS
jgi:hypothetical protein